MRSTKQDKPRGDEMKNYTAVSLKADDVNFEVDNDTEARHWVINHLDLSLNWSIFKTHKD